MKAKDENKVTKEEMDDREAAAAKIQVNEDNLIIFLSFPCLF